MTLLEEDRALLDGFRRGDRSALATVFVSYCDDVARQVRAARVAEHDVESLVHDVFLKAFAPSARQTYDGLRPYGAWLNVITRNVVIDRARKERRTEPRAPADMPVLRADDDPREEQEARELARIVDVWKQALDADDARLFAARFDEGRSLPQTAQVLGWSEIRVRKRDTALRTALLAALRQAGFLEQARVTIGSSLLGRRAPVNPKTPKEP